MSTSTLTRRDAIKALASAAGALSLVSCKPPAPKATVPVVLYTSADALVVEAVTSAFTQQTGIAVRAVTDTEATKAAGLVQRLIAERDAPRAEVWWSSEVVGTMVLAREGLLVPSAPAALHEEFSGSWPQGLCDAGGLWWGFAQRARVAVYSTTRVQAASVPTSLEALAAFTPKGRVAIAQPQFGTTRTHFAWVVHTLGEAEARSLLQRLRANCRFYPGNSAVVRAVAQGECDVGLADTDDVWAGQGNQWSVDASFAVGACGAPPLALFIPNTAGLVGGTQPRKEARALLDFLCSGACERTLAQSESHNIPIRAELRDELASQIPELRLPVPANAAVSTPEVNWASVAGSLSKADAIIAEAFPL
jgi:iron(III) transport system substrate-binding protein